MQSTQKNLTHWGLRNIFRFLVVLATTRPIYQEKSNSGRLKILSEGLSKFNLLINSHSRWSAIHKARERSPVCFWSMLGGP